MNELQKAQKHLNDAIKPWRSFFSARNTDISADDKCTVLRMLKHLSGGYAYSWNNDPHHSMSVHSTYGLNNIRYHGHNRQWETSFYDSSKVTQAHVATSFMALVLRGELHLDMLDGVTTDDVVKAVQRHVKLHSKLTLLVARATTDVHSPYYEWRERDYSKRAIKLLYRIQGANNSSSYLRASLFGMSDERSKYVTAHVMEDIQESIDRMFTASSDLSSGVITQLSGVYSLDTSSSYVLHLPNQNDTPNLRFEYSKLGKVVRKSCPQLDDEEVKEITNTYVAGEVEISNSYQAFHEAYNTAEYGSCMEDVSNDGVYAWEVYVDSPNAAVAILRNANGGMMGRAIVNTQDMQFDSVYGNFQLCDKLKRMGYTRSSSFSDGLLIRKMMYADDYDDEYLIAPYVDGDGEYCNPHEVACGEFMPLSCDGTLCLDSTDGRYEL